MRISKEKFALTAVLAFALAIVLVFIVIFYSSRPKLVLSDMISYFPETVDISTIQNNEPLTRITDINEIENLFVVLSIGNWKHENKQDNIQNGLESSYRMNVNEYLISMNGQAGEKGHISVEKNDAIYYYALPAKLYSEIELYITQLPIVLE